MYLQLYARIFLPYNINCNPFLWLTITTCICKLLLCKRSSLHNRKYRHSIYVTLLYTKYETWNSYFFICSIHNLYSFKSDLEADGNYFTSISFYNKTCLWQWKNSKSWLEGQRFPSLEILTLKGFELAARNGTGRGQVARRTADKSRRTTSDRHADQILSAIYY